MAKKVKEKKEQEIQVNNNEELNETLNKFSKDSSINKPSEEEIQEAILLAKFAAGWSKYFTGSLYDRDLFLKELSEVGTYLSEK